MIKQTQHHLIKSAQQRLIKIPQQYLLTYHSLSIERYRVTPELITKVSSGEWNLKENEEDRKQRDAMAARGYFLTFQASVGNNILPFTQFLGGLVNKGMQGDPVAILPK